MTIHQILRKQTITNNKQTKMSTHELTKQLNASQETKTATNVNDGSDTIHKNKTKKANK